MDAPNFTLVARGGTWHPFIQYDFSPSHQPVLLVFVPSGVDPHMIWEGSHLVWISLWLVAIG